jgi:hypothetical protein
VKITICDIDNCIADDAWRIPQIEWHRTGDARYDRYHRLSPADMCRNRNLLTAAYALGHTVIFSTGRPTPHRAITERWLRHDAGLLDRPFMLLMRAAGDARHAPAIKYDHTHSILANFPRAEIVAAYDDHPGVIEMYAGLGIQATKIAIHDSYAAYSAEEVPR